MQAKNAPLHCSYASPTRVSDGATALRATVAERATGAAERTVALRAEAGGVVILGWTVLAERATTLCGAAARDWTTGAALRPPSPRLRGAGDWTAGVADRSTRRGADAAGAVRDASVLCDTSTRAGTNVDEDAGAIKQAIKMGNRNFFMYC